MLGNPREMRSPVGTWLKDQAGIWYECLDNKTPLDLLEVYTSATCRLTKEMRRAGGRAIALGYEHGQDFRRRADRILSYVLILAVVVLSFLVVLLQSHWMVIQYM